MENSLGLYVDVLRVVWKNYGKDNPPLYSSVQGCISSSSCASVSEPVLSNPTQPSSSRTAGSGMSSASVTARAKGMRVACGDPEAWSCSRMCRAICVPVLDSLASFWIDATSSSLFMTDFLDAARGCRFNALKRFTEHVDSALRVVDRVRCDVEQHGCLKGETALLRGAFRVPPRDRAEKPTQATINLHPSR
jgi:hypothetical protein